MSMLFYGHPLSSYTWKALIALYETGADFAWRQLDWQDEAVQAEFAALWPIRKFPLLVDRGRTIVESSTIIEYLDLQYPGPTRLIPADAEAALRVRMLDRIFDNYVMTPMQAIVFDRIRPDGSHDPYGVGQARDMIERAYGWLEGEIGSGWAAGGDFGLADCAAAPSLHYAEKVQPMAGRFPAVAAYLARLEARPSVARVLDEAKPYAHMFPQES